MARRNDSLGRRGRWQVFGALAFASFALAAAFVAAGAWPVLPYSVLEMAVLGAAFVCIERRAGDWERLTVAGDRVIVEREVAGRQERREWNRCWLQVDCDESAGGPVLTLRSAGQAWRFGSALPPGERRKVAHELRRIARG